MMMFVFQGLIGNCACMHDEYNATKCVNNGGQPFPGFSFVQNYDKYTAPPEPRPLDVTIDVVIREVTKVDHGSSSMTVRLDYQTKWFEKRMTVNNTHIPKSTSLKLNPD